MFEFAVRDDDPNYFTDPTELEAPYMDYDFPVSFAIVPFQGCTDIPTVPENYHQGDEEFPLGENESLVEYLRAEVDAGNISVLLHGYNHVYYESGPEFVAGEDLGGRVERGLGYLEGLLGTDVDMFVPPSNSFSRRGLEAVKAAGLKTFYYPTPFGRPKTPEVIRMFLKDLRFKYRHKNTGLTAFLRDSDRFWRREDRDVFMPVQPFPYHVQGQGEFTAVSLSETSDIGVIRRQLELADHYNGGFCLAVHYHSFRSETFREKFEDIISYAREELNPRFVHAGELF